MSDSTMTDEQKYEMNYGVPPDEQEEVAKKLRKLGVKVRSMPITIWLVDGTYLSPDTMRKRLEEGYYDKKEKDAGQSEMEVPTRKRRSARTVVSSKDTVPKQGVRLRGDSDERINKRKGTRRNGSRTSKGVRRQHTEVEEEPRKKTSPVRKQRTRISKSEGNNRPRETRVERRRRLGLDQSKSRGTKRGTKSRR